MGKRINDFTITSMLFRRIFIEESAIIFQLLLLYKQRGDCVKLHCSKSFTIDRTDSDRTEW